MFWLEEQWGDLPRDGEGSSCSSPLQKGTSEESKSIHFPLTSWDYLGRAEGGSGSDPSAGEMGEGLSLCRVDHRISRSWNHGPAPRARCLLQQTDDKDKPQRFAFMPLIFNLRRRRGETELESPPAALSSCPSCGKWGVDSLWRERRERKGVLFVWQGQEGLDVHDCVLCSVPLVLLEGCFSQEKCGGGSLMKSVAIQCPQWILGGVECLSLDLSCPAVGLSLRDQVRNPLP